MKINIISLFLSWITIDAAIDILSIITLLIMTCLFFYIIIKYFKGMRKPPFWTYLIFGFLLLTLHSVAIVIPAFTVHKTYLAILRLAAHLLMLFGVLELFRSYRARVKFDKKR